MWHSILGLLKKSVQSCDAHKLSNYCLHEFWRRLSLHEHVLKGKGRALDIAPQVDTATTEALRYMARTKQRRTYLPYTFPAIEDLQRRWVPG